MLLKQKKNSSGILETMSLIDWHCCPERKKKHWTHAFCAANSWFHILDHSPKICKFHTENSSVKSLPVVFPPTWTFLPHLRRFTLEQSIVNELRISTLVLPSTKPLYVAQCWHQHRCRLRKNDTSTKANVVITWTGMMPFRGHALCAVDDGLSASFPPQHVIMRQNLKYKSGSWL